jgi:hypothetical protein
VKLKKTRPFPHSHAGAWEREPDNAVKVKKTRNFFGGNVSVTNENHNFGCSMKEEAPMTVSPFLWGEGLGCSAKGDRPRIQAIHIILGEFNVV